MRREFTVHVGSGSGDSEHAEAKSAHTDLHRPALDSARRATLDMRANGDIGDDAFHQLEEELDWIEMAGSV